MAENNFGKASLQLSADATQLKQGLAEAQGTVGTFVTSINGSLANIGGGLQGLATSALPGAAKNIATAFTTAGPWGAALQAVLEIKNVAKQTFDAIVGYWNQAVAGIKGIVDEAKLGQRLGLGFETFQAMMYGTKQSAQELSDSLTTMGNAVQAARIRGGRAAIPFKSLGFDNEEIRQLGTLGADEQFSQIAERIKNLATPMQQLSAATAIWGANGAAMLAQINRGVEGNIARAREYNLILGTEQIANMQRAQSAANEAGQVQQGIWRQASAAVAPFVAICNEFFLVTWRSFSPVIKSVIDVLLGLGQGVMQVWDQLKSEINVDGIREMFGQFTVDIPTVKAVVIDAAEAIALAFIGLMDYVRPVGSAFIEYLAVPYQRAIATMQTTMAGWLTSFNEGFLTPTVQGIRNFITSLEGLASLDPTGTLTANLTAARVALDALPAATDIAVTALQTAANINNSTANSLLDMAQVANNFNNGEQLVQDFFQRVRNRTAEARQNIANGGGLFDPEMLKRAGDLLDKFESPLVKMQREMRNLNELWEEGLIDQETYGRGLDDIISQAEQNLKIGPAKYASLAFEGSREAASAIYHRADNERADDPQERIRRVLERSQQLQQIQADNSNRLVQLLQDRPDLIPLGN